MAPDKIYVSRNFSEDNSPHGLWYLDKSEHDINVEYIREDALLEFLKKKVNEIEIAMETGADDPVLWGQRNAFKQVIDKINSM